MMHRDWTALIEGVGMVAGLVGAIVSLWVRSEVARKVATAKEELTAEEIEPLKKQNAAQHDSIVRLEAQCAQQATRDDMHKLGMQLERALGEMKAMQVGMADLRDEQKATRTSVQRVNDYLLNSKVS